ncbi:hypothetical protein CesoFtcFv8_010106 [Champsocephalus esox]|uniref:Uncharacterized protein n=1 Tax=Champsocephalus esox TaxID=159716 RepID=A0AAN8C3U3_9TELE|nr:hypothetical protein CesoFtcFv8_010106 [Champsocephalus esox]
MVPKTSSWQRCVDSAGTPAAGSQCRADRESTPVWRWCEHEAGVDEEEGDGVCEIKNTDRLNECGVVEIGAFTLLHKHIPSHSASRARASELELARQMAAIT